MSFIIMYSYNKIHYCGKIMGKTDFIDLVDNWSSLSMALNVISNVNTFVEC